MSTTVPVDERQESPQCILVPLDGSRLSAKALELAARLPARELILLHVERDNQTIFPGFSLGNNDDETGDIQSRLESWAAPLRTGGRAVEVDIRSGDAIDEILAAAADCDLVVMATQGRHAAGRLLFGSTADRVSRHSPIPALLVRAIDDDAAIPVPARIVVPLDGSKLAEAALPIAASLARAMSLPVRLVRAVDLDDVRDTIQAERERERGAPAPEDEEHTYAEARQRTEKRAAAYLGETARSLQDQGLDVHMDVLQGTPVFALLEAIEPDDLVAMTSHGRRGFRRWMLGSVAEKLVRESKGPVLLVPTRKSPSPAGS